METRYVNKYSYIENCKNGNIEIRLTQVNGKKQDIFIYDKESNEYYKYIKGDKKDTLKKSKITKKLFNDYKIICMSLNGLNKNLTYYWSISNYLDNIQPIKIDDVYVDVETIDKKNFGLKKSKRTRKRPLRIEINNISDELHDIIKNKANDSNKTISDFLKDIISKELL